MAAADLPAIESALEAATTESGAALVELVAASSVLLVFLRHAGCTFCREALSDIAEVRSAIESNGTRVVLVHMGDRTEMDTVIARYGLTDLDRICDPERRLYNAFGLARGSWSQLYGLKVWIRGVIAGLFRGHGISAPAADASQMPGVFFIDKGWIVQRFRHRSAADRPSYVSLCENGPDRKA